MSIQSTQVVISVLFTILLILLGINLYFNWQCNKDISDNNKVFNIMTMKTFKNNLNIFSALIILMMWLYCIFSLATSTNKAKIVNEVNEVIGSDTST